MKNKIIVLQGIPASGKSTWARNFVKGKTDWVIVNRDSLRLMRGDYWIPNQEKYITDIEVACVMAAIKNNLNIIIDATNLNQKTINRWTNIINTHYKDSYDLEFKMFEITLEEAIERDKNRELQVTAPVITEFYNKYIKK